MSAEPRIVATCNLKGGAGKTTTAAYVAHALHERGMRTFAVDADPQGSLYTWHQATPFPFPCVRMPSAKLYREVPGVVGDRYAAVVIDTPPTEHGRQIVLSAVRGATHVLVPIAPSPVEYERLPDLLAVIEEATELRPDERPPAVGVLLVRTITGASSTGTYRNAITQDGWPVLRSSVPRREEYVQAYGEAVIRARATGYGDAVAELLGLDREQVTA